MTLTGTAGLSVQFECDVLFHVPTTLALAVLRYRHGTAYELHVDVEQVSNADLDRASLLMPAGLTVLSLAASAALGGRGEVCITFWQATGLAVTLPDQSSHVVVVPAAFPVPAVASSSTAVVSRR